jgi:tetratricopeptide (TPR) repeat protein
MKKLLIILLTTLSFYATALPDSAKQDMYLLGLSDALKEKDYQDALIYIEKLDALNVEMPNVVNYYRGEALFHLKDYIDANTYLTQYIETSGTKGKHYKSALQLLLKAEPMVEKAKQEKQKKERLLNKIFSYSVVAIDSNTLRASWKILPGYYLFRDKLFININGVEFNNINFPKGKIKNDELFGVVEVYWDMLDIEIPLTNIHSSEIIITAKFQGCYEKGLCYPPIEKTTRITLPK